MTPGEQRARLDDRTARACVGRDKDLGGRSDEGKLMRSARIAVSIVASAAIAALGLSTPTSATSTSPPAGDPIATGLVGPLQFEVAGTGRIYVGQSFAGLLSAVNTNGKVVTLTAEEGSVTGVAADEGRVAYTFRGGEGPSPALGGCG
jgi:hypothetical protein